MSVKDLIKYYKKLIVAPKDLKPKKIYLSKFEQDASNCRIYAMCNNAYCNLWFVVDVDKIKKEIESHWKDSSTWWRMLASWLFVAKQIGNMMCYEILPNKYPKLFAKLIKEWYVFGFARRHNSALKEDIKDNWVVDNAIDTDWGRHATNCYRDGKHIVELGSRWDSQYNNFKYTLTSFINSIRKKTIKESVYFINHK